MSCYRERADGAYLLLAILELQFYRFNKFWVNLRLFTAEVLFEIVLLVEHLKISVQSDHLLEYYHAAM